MASARVLTFLANFVVVGLMASVLAAAPRELVPTVEPLTTGSPVALLDAHDCWSGEAPPDMERRLPGHVVLSVGAGDPTYAGSVMVGRALDQVFDGVDHGLVVYGFCR